MLHKVVKSIPFALLLATAPAGARDQALQMVSIDVEGGGGTLFVTPDGKSLLIDTGNPEQSRITGDHPSSERIANAAHALGVKKIDTLIITHYHGDHIGGIEGLLARIPIGTVMSRLHRGRRLLAGRRARRRGLSAGRRHRGRRAAWRRSRGV